MFDARIRPFIDPPLTAIGATCARWGISANSVTLAAILPGVASATAIAHGHFLAGLVLLLLNRIADGIDGAVARANGATDFGGYLDIVSDFVVYVSIPVGFGLAAPSNVVPSMVLVASFALTGVSFLAFATIAAKQRLETTAHGPKSFFYSTGLAEGAETIAVFTLMCLAPAWFPTIAIAYSGLCILTVIQRTVAARTQFREPQ